MPSTPTNVPEEVERARPLPRRSFDCCCDLDTLCRAKEIMDDPERLQAAKEEAERQSTSYKRLANLKGRII